jgi:hypothetical protein
MNITPTTAGVLLADITGHTPPAAVNGTAVLGGAQ